MMYTEMLVFTLKFAEFVGFCGFYVYSQYP